MKREGQIVQNFKQPDGRGQRDGINGGKLVHMALSRVKSPETSGFQRLCAYRCILGSSMRRVPERPILLAPPGIAHRFFDERFGVPYVGQRRIAPAGGSAVALRRRKIALG